MGTIIEITHLPDESERLSRLLVYMKSINRPQEPYSIGRQLAEAIYLCKPNRRSMRLASIFDTVLDSLPDGIVIRDIDVLFNPSYEVDILKMLIESRKRKRFSVIWPGRCKDGKLIYSEEGYPDYKTYNIDDYDITCVIGGYDK